MSLTQNSPEYPQRKLPVIDHNQENPEAINQFRQQIRLMILQNSTAIQPKELGRIDREDSAEELQIEQLLQKVRDPHQVSRITKAEQHILRRWLQQQGYTFRFAHKQGSFQRRYAEKYHSWRRHQGGLHHDHHLEKLAREIEMRLWMMDPDADSVVYSARHQITVWSRQSLDELFRKGFALAKHSAYSSSAAES